VLGTINAYYMEIAIQVGIFVALALGLNIVVGLAGLLDLAMSPSSRSGPTPGHIRVTPGNQMFGGSAFRCRRGGSSSSSSSASAWPREPAFSWAAVLRLHGDYLALVTLGFGEVIRVLANNLDKPINITNVPRASRPSATAHLLRPAPAALGIDPSSNVIYPLYLYALVLLIVGVTVLVNRRLEDSHIGRAWRRSRGPDGRPGLGVRSCA